ncbi:MULTISPECIES: hypothetical protein [Paenibacillus]|uniref:Uncharacterized protein n=2 Tax=Paenibacillus TaxID=44249 RepID=A0AAJ2K370_9BACL|nr:MULTISPECIES: hypothetical protein [Paenibacillus]MDT8979554.1 hypothetical protein [Paenibacillus sp. chi10]GAV14497.1 hypothetical protein PBN151_4459 [Paenibacillus sp. NAIST15-1]SYX82053.1 conserved protein of unknown function [Paenibacillus alvei]
MKNNNQVIVRKPWNVRWLAAAKAAASIVLLGAHSNETQQVKEGA